MTNLAHATGAMIVIDQSPSRLEEPLDNLTFDEVSAISSDMEAIAVPAAPAPARAVTPAPSPVPTPPATASVLVSSIQPPSAQKSFPAKLGLCPRMSMPNASPNANGEVSDDRGIVRLKDARI